jgi:hypothetical protein
VSEENADLLKGIRMRGYLDPEAAIDAAALTG